VALTIDDGPDPTTTPELLRVMRSHGARATFFLLGERAQRRPDLVRRVVADGHEVANHRMREEEPTRSW
jgi:peptidoglycan/xylan/chitin deacetylase (PgdA/CDA1 family)